MKSQTSSQSQKAKLIKDILSNATKVEDLIEYDYDYLTTEEMIWLLRKVKSGKLKGKILLTEKELAKYEDIVQRIKRRVNNKYKHLVSNGLSQNGDVVPIE